MSPAKRRYIVTVTFRSTGTMIWMSKAEFITIATSDERAANKVQRQCLLAGMKVWKVRAELDC